MEATDTDRRLHTLRTDYAKLYNKYLLTTAKLGKASHEIAWLKRALQKSNWKIHDQRAQLRSLHKKWESIRFAVKVAEARAISARARREDPTPTALTPEERAQVREDDQPCSTPTE
jgi:Fic family protein